MEKNKVRSNERQAAKLRGAQIYQQEMYEFLQTEMDRLKRTTKTEAELKAEAEVRRCQRHAKNQDFFSNRQQQPPSNYENSYPRDDKHNPAKECESCSVSLSQLVEKLDTKLEEQTSSQGEKSSTTASPNYRLAKSARLLKSEDVPLPQNARPWPGPPSDELLKYLSLGADGKPLLTTLTAGSTLPPAEHEWTDHDYRELPPQPQIISDLVDY